MKSITVGELKANFSEILKLVQTKKEEIIIEYGRNRKKIAKIVPFEEEKSFNPEKFFGIANFSKNELDSYLENIRKEWDNINE